MEGEEGCKAPDSTSRDLLSVGSGTGGLYNKLLINKKHSNNGPGSPIVRMPRSSILDRVQNFLPQLAQANERLSKEMESSPAGVFDIEQVEDHEEKIIEMNVSVVELDDSDTSDGEAASSSDSDVSEEVTEENIRLTKKVKKGNIEVLEN
ncbi:Hypothetical predicted protein [Pelobates cultripes]|uniref:Uncharacterized protein n=1 Tax=Pelobates cultripes TaxID=61616 RepID=A0AAD1RTF2_PELCU|nr:Hypothetical predicted protein [Pelobates cultripes]